MRWFSDCLPACPVDAITIEKREAAEYNEELVKKNMEKPVHTGGCPGSALKEFARSESNYSESDYESKLKQWPVQIKLDSGQQAPILIMLKF